jgi:ABC-2 type transport system permease protein
MNAVRRALWNPIVAKEYRSRMRTWRSPLAMMIYVVLLGGLGWAVFSSIMAGAVNLGGGNNYATMALQLFTFLIIFQVALLSFITPAVTAGAISGERERQTIDLLFVTPLPPFSIIWGKLLASMSFAVLLLMLSVPIFSLVFLFGGIELDQMLYAFLITGLTALMLGMIGIACSTIFKHTLASTVAAYAAAFVVLVGTLIYGQLFPVEVDPTSTTIPAPQAVTFISPVIPLLTIADNQPVGGYGVRYPNGGPFFNGGGGVSCTTFANGTQQCVPVGGPTGGAVTSINSFQSQPTTGALITTGVFKGWQYWQASAVMQLMICAVALLVSALLLPPVRRFGFRRAAPAAPALT